MTSVASRSAPESIFHNRPFMLLWAAQFITQTAQQAIWFGMIIVVEQISRSSVHLSVAILSTIIPGVLFGLIAGVVVDRSNKKTVLVVTNGLRAVTVLGYLFYARSLYFVYLVNFLFVGISQFFGPAEASSIPALVPKRNLVTASSMFNLTFTISQLVGIVLLAPWIIKFFGASTLFTLTGLIYVIASVLTSLLPPGVPPERPLSTLHRSALIRVARQEILEAWGFITYDRRTWWAMTFVTLASTMMLIMAMLAPRYVVAVVGVQPEDAVYLFAPAGLGILLMTLSLDRLARRFGEMVLAYAGGIIMGLALLLMAVLPRFSDFFQRLLAAGLGTTSPLAGSQALIPPLMAISLLIGIGFALANIPSQSVLMERAPVQSRGRIFSVVLLMGNVAAITPLAFLGALADLYGETSVVALIGVLTLGITILGLRERSDVLTTKRHAEEGLPS